MQTKKTDGNEPFGWVKANSIYFNSSKGRLSTVDKSDWIPGNLLISKNASPSKSFVHIRSWSITMKWIIAPLFWQSFSVKRLNEKKSFDVLCVSSYNSISRCIEDWEFSSRSTFVVCPDEKINNEDEYELRRTDRWESMTNLGDERVKKSVTLNHWNRKVWDFYSRSLRRTTFLLSHDNKLDNRVDLNLIDWCDSLVLTRVISSRTKTFVLLSFIDLSTDLIIKFDQWTRVHRMIFQ